MGVLYSGPFSGFRNKVGNLVGYKSRGLEVIRVYAVPSNPRSESQVSQRSKFLVSLLLAGALNNYSSFVSFWNSVKEIGQTYFSQFMKANVKHCTSSEPVVPFSAFPTVGAFQTNLTVSDLALIDYDISATVPPLSSVFSNLEGYSDAFFYLAFIATSPSGAQQLVNASLLTKIVPGYNFGNPYSLIVNLDNFSKSLLTDYQRTSTQIMVRITGDNMPDLFSVSPLSTFL